MKHIETKPSFLNPAYQNLVSIICLCFTLALLLSACGSAVQPTAVTRTVEQARSTPTRQAGNTATSQPENPLLLSQRALRQQEAFSIHMTVLTGHIEPSDVYSTQESEYRIVSSSPEQMTVHTQTERGTEEIVCALPPGQTGGHRTCVIRAGQHPWLRYETLEGYEWLRSRDDVLRQLEIVDTTVNADKQEITVSWKMRNPSFAGIQVSGTTWLQTETYLPLREETIQHRSDGSIFGKNLMTFSFSKEAQPIELPQAATATPAPSVPADVVSTLADLEVQEAEMPFPGKLFVPKDPGTYPAVIVLHGSDGDSSGTRQVASQLTHAGFVSMALCYFGCPGAASSLDQVNVETVMDAVAYLQSRPDVQDGPVGLVGYSRGAELALIVGSLDANVGPVASVMGTPWVQPGLSMSADAWHYQGKPLPFLAIPVEQINGPVLLLHGEADRLWPVNYSYLLADWLEKQQQPYELVVYPARQHDILTDPPDAINRVQVFFRTALLGEN